MDFISLTSFGGFIGTSRAMQSVYDVIENAAPSMASVFITGASGTGKDIAAQALHKCSPRAKAPFIAINCAAIPRDLMESEIFGHMKGAFTGAVETREGAAARADGGTLFLDEICDMPVEMQGKLLRFLQDGRFTKVGSNKIERSNVRVVCATNKDPAAMIEAGYFREDLYYRLHVVPLVMPALKDRGGDIVELADMFLKRAAAHEGKIFTGFTPEAMGCLQHHAWPGNVRELENLVRQIVVLHKGPLVTFSMLPSYLTHNQAPAAQPAHPPAIKPLWEIEKQVIEHAISSCNGNISRAAALLEISPSTIYRKKAEWGGDRLY